MSNMLCYSDGFIFYFMLDGIMPPRKQKSDVSYSTIKRTAWGPRPNISEF